MEKKILKKLHDTQIEILDEVVRICKKEKINYFLIGGTLLGAIRHKGFIPWDDDIDLGMTRDDYEKFIKVAPKTLNKKFLLECRELNKNFYLPFAKLRNVNTSFDEESTKYYNGNKGIWIDIFPIDYSKQDLNKKIIIKDRISKYILYAILIRNINYKNKKVLNFILKIFPTSFYWFVYNILTKNNNSNLKYLTAYASVYTIKKEVYKVDDYFPLIKGDFEGKKYNIPKEYDKCLKQVYKDYMKLPPKEKRVTHNPNRILFEDGEEIIFKK